MAVSVVLTAAERARLLEETQVNLDRVAELSRKIDPSTLGPDDTEKFRSMEQLVRSANEALQNDDPTAAASLSRKARLLAEELVNE